ALTACVDGAMGGCEAEAMCPVRGRWDPVNRAIRDALAHVTVADLAGANHARRAPALVLNA
ncbi:MAG: SUF system Fe-S cluster assembly regulator, partial [Rhodospirillales bacterium]|nr:SUF system Fe-S cluster assembly regulator [Rhodospirillales bacterium]